MLSMMALVISPACRARAGAFLRHSSANTLGRIEIGWQIPRRCCRSRIQHVACAASITERSSSLRAFPHLAERT
jgi:hypothetical protein